VSVLIGDAAAASGAPSRLIECADPVRSGVAAATDAELGTDPSGWRCGRRGLLDVDRPADPVFSAGDVAAPRGHQRGPDDASRLTVVDAGWPAWDVIAGSGWVSELARTAPVVLVVRLTVPGVRQAEQLLAALPTSPLIAAVGPAKWPGAVAASCGPRMRAARGDDRVVAVPFDRALDVTGLTPGPLPTSLQAAGRSLATHLYADRTGIPPRG